MELVHKCNDCGKKLEMDEIRTIPGEDFTDRFTGLTWAIGKKFCEECYKNNTTAASQLWQENYDYEKLDNLNANTKFGKIKAVVIRKVSEEKKSKDGKGLMLGKFEIEDYSGKMLLTLWNNDIYGVDEKNVLIIENGYVREFGNEKQITLGRDGKLVVLK